MAIKIVDVKEKHVNNIGDYVDNVDKAFERVAKIKGLVAGKNPTDNSHDLEGYLDELVQMTMIPNDELHEAIQPVRDLVNKRRFPSMREVSVEEPTQQEQDEFIKLFKNAFDLDKKTGKLVLNEKVAALICQRHYIEYVGDITVEKIKVALEEKKASPKTGSGTAAVGSETYKPSNIINEKEEDLLGND
jgi:hypothetical protein